MGDLSNDLVEGQLALPVYDGWEQAVTDRLLSLEQGADYFRALTETDLAVLEEARRNDIFRGCRGLVHGFHGDRSLEDWFLALVESNEGCLTFAVRTVQKMARGGPRWWEHE